jgi:replicative DNA helicase
MTVQQIVSRARATIHRKGVRVIAVDYAQRVGSDAKEERLRVAQVSSGLTALAKDTGVHVLLLSQLRKVGAEYQAKAPTLADLRETSALGDDAHCVLLLHRGWDEESGGLEDDGEIIIPKQRSGVTSAFPVEFEATTGVFRDARRKPSMMPKPTIRYKNSAQ